MDVSVAATCVSIRFHLKQLLLTQRQQQGLRSENDTSDDNTHHLSLVRGFLSKARTDLVRAIVALKLHVASNAIATAGGTSSSPSSDRLDGASLPDAELSEHHLLLSSQRKRHALSVTALPLMSLWPRLAKIAAANNNNTGCADGDESSTAVWSLLSDVARRPRFDIRAFEAHFYSDVSHARVTAAERVGAALVVCSMRNADDGGDHNHHHDCVDVTIRGAASVRFTLVARSSSTSNSSGATTTFSWLPVTQSLDWKIMTRAVNSNNNNMATPAALLPTAVDRRSILEALGASAAGSLARAILTFAALVSGLYMELIQSQITARQHMQQNITLTAPAQQQQLMQQNVIGGGDGGRPAVPPVTMHCGLQGGRRISFSVLSSNMSCVAHHQSSSRNDGRLIERVLLPLPANCDPNDVIICDLNDLLNIS